MIHHGDCLEVMAAMDPESIDAIVTDPPYGLEFMGKAWDHGVMGRPFADAMYRVAKPSAYLLAFGGTRTVHRMTVALEDAGWIIRDMLVWAYASGFPKSKASLKPAWEPIVMARKPGPLRMLNIDECRIGVAEGDGWDVPARDITGANPFVPGAANGTRTDGRSDERATPHPSGRWPANVILTDPIFDGGGAGVVGGGEAKGWASQQRLTPADKFATSYSPGLPQQLGQAQGYDDTGTYSRFFLVPKAARSDREPVLGGLPTEVTKPYNGNLNNAAYEYSDGAHRDASRRPARANVHPTVKPTDLMRHLVRLVTPTGGVVLDPFLGSGTTGLAAEMEGFEWVGIEREEEYVRIAEARLNGTQRGLGLET